MLMPYGNIDPGTALMQHDNLYREEVAFWNSLDKAQAQYLGKIFSAIAGARDDAHVYAHRFMGNLEAYMAIRFKSCTCGREHDDDAAIQSLYEEEAVDKKDSDGRDGCSE